MARRSTTSSSSCWMRVFGTSEVAMRSLSLVAAAATMVPFHAVARRLLDRPAAWAAGAVLATSPFLLAYARDARTYALAVLLVVLAAWTFLRAVASGAAAGLVGVHRASRSWRSTPIGSRRWSCSRCSSRRDRMRPSAARLRDRAVTSACVLAVGDAADRGAGADGGQQRGRLDRAVERRRAPRVASGFTGREPAAAPAGVRWPCSWRARGRLADAPTGRHRRSSSRGSAPRAGDHRALVVPSPCWSRGT